MITIEDFQEAIDMFGAIEPAPLPRINPQRVLDAGPRPRGRWHMLRHKKRRIRKKWQKRLAPVIRAEADWSSRSGVILHRGQLFVLTGKPLDLLAPFDWWREPVPEPRSQWLFRWGHPLLTTPRSLITMDTA